MVFIFIRLLMSAVPISIEFSEMLNVKTRPQVLPC